MQVTIATVTNHAGSKIERNWKRNCQVIEDAQGNVYVNTPSISGDTFEEGLTYNVGFGNSFGATTGINYRTININK